MTSLIGTLIGLGAIAKDSMVTARCGTQNRYGIITYSIHEYVLEDITENTNVLCLRQANGNEIINATIDDITAIDGMCIERYAEIYNVNLDGTLKSTGRKRGRKPKIR